MPKLAAKSATTPSKQTINEQHGFPPDFSVPEMTQDMMSMLFLTLMFMQW